MATVMIGIATDPESLAFVVGAAIITMVVLGFILRPIWRSPDWPDCSPRVNKRRV
jgi:hypothetical protein